MNFHPNIDLAPNKKIYFASDFHFGIPDYATTRTREDLVCNWLDSIKHDAQQIYLVGDIFDSWMEYKKVVPKGSVRFLGKLAELSDHGIKLIFFTGNHDLWMHGYFEQELHAIVYKTEQSFYINGKLFHVAHGDGVSKKEKSYRVLKGLLHNKISQLIYRQLHPDIGLRIADWFSRQGPKHKYENLKMKDADAEYQLMYAHEVLAEQHIDYFVFGHRHIACRLELNEKSTFINLGDWITFNTYAVFDGNELRLETYRKLS